MFIGTHPVSHPIQCTFHYYLNPVFLVSGPGYPPAGRFTTVPLKALSGQVLIDIDVNDFEI